VTRDITAGKGRLPPALRYLYHSWCPAESSRAGSLKQEWSEGYKICQTGMQQSRQIMKKRGAKEDGLT